MDLPAQARAPLPERWPKGSVFAFSTPGPCIGRSPWRAFAAASIGTGRSNWPPWRRALTCAVAGDKIFLDGENVTEAIRSLEVTAVTRHAADNPSVRAHLVRLQRAIAGNDDIVAEGRDQGTIVFPFAQCKIFLTAREEERARRRLRDLQARNEPATFDEVLAGQRRRDREDSTRAVGPLTPAPDAIELCTDGLTLDEAVARVEALVRKQRNF